MNVCMSQGTTSSNLINKSLNKIQGSNSGNKYNIDLSRYINPKMLPTKSKHK